MELLFYSSPETSLLVFLGLFTGAHIKNPLTLIKLNIITTGVL